MNIQGLRPKPRAPNCVRLLVLLGKKCNFAYFAKIPLFVKFYCTDAQSLQCH